MTTRQTLARVSVGPALFRHNGIVQEAKGYKTIYRPDGPFADPISVVRDTYSVIQTADIIERIEEQMRLYFGPGELSSAKITSKITHDGRRTYDDYQFNIGKQVGVSTVAFRTTLINSYDGSTGVLLIVGGNYYICTNGMLIGEHELISKKHVGQLILPNMNDLFERALREFDNEALRWMRWNKYGLTLDERDALVKEYDDSERVQTKMHMAYQDAAKSHGETLWAMYNAGTFLATHGEIRAANQNNAMAIQHDRSMRVRAWTNSKTWRDIERLAA